MSEDAFPSALRALDLAAMTAGALHDLAPELARIRSGPHGEELQPVLAGLEYFHIERRNSEQRGRYGAAFGPIIEVSGRAYPPPLQQLPEGYADTWALALEHVTDPLLIARYADLLWEAQPGAGAHLRARQAVGAYRELGQQSRIDPLERADALDRAHELASRLNDQQAVRGIIEEAAVLARAELVASNARPGVFFRLFDIARVGPEAVNLELLELAAETYSGDPDNLDVVDDYRHALASVDGARRAIRQGQVRRLLDRASAAEGLLAYSFREEAIERATNYGLSDLANEARLAIQRSPLERADFAVISTDIDVAPEAVERVLDLARAQTTWPSVLESLISVGPPTGNLDENTEMVRSSAAATPFLSLIPIALTGPDGLTIRVYRTPEERFEHDLAQAEGLGLLIFSRVLVEALRNARERLGSAQSDELAATFADNPIVDAETAERIAVGIQLHSQGEFDQSALALLPRIERVLRELSRALDLVVVDEPKSGRVGGVRALGALPSGLNDPRGIDPSWRRFLVHVLIDPPGRNLRNELLHGIRATASEEDSALIVYAAAYVARLRIERANT